MDRNKRFGWIFIAALILLLCLGYFLKHFFHHKPRLAQEVVVCQAIAQDVPVYLSALGTVNADTRVVVKSQVNGVLSKILFQEGQAVKKNQLLAQIDARPFQAQVLEFQGQLARDEALLTNAQTDLKRYQTLFKLNSIAAQTLATQKSLVKQLEGTIKLDQGQLDNAKVNLSYCEITSPINGRIGLQQVDAGNVVQTSDPNGIAVINTINPISVVFTLPEDDVPLIEKSFYSGVKLTAEAYDRTQRTLLAKGTLTAMDSQIDSSTGTVKLKADFSNTQNNLFPNQFVNIQLLVKSLLHVVTLPVGAVQQGNNGPFVYVVDKEKQIVHVKPVITGVTRDQIIVIEKGLLPGQLVVLEGADRLTDGAAISVYQQPNANTKTTI